MWKRRGNRVQMGCHRNGLSPVCDRMCTAKCVVWEKPKVQPSYRQRNRVGVSARLLKS